MKNKLFIISIISCYALFAQDSVAKGTLKKSSDKGYFPCMTLGATYIEKWEEFSGTCGKVPDMLINISPNGTASLSDCEKKTIDGCTTTGTNCKTDVGNGVIIDRSFMTQMSSDGKTGNSFEMVQWTFSGKLYCHSIYKTTFIRVPK